MTFRKNSLFFYEGQIFFGVMILASLASMPLLGIWLTLQCVLPFAVLILVFPKLQNEYITINEKGISCHTSKLQIWAYEWDGIAELKRGSSHYLLPSMEVIPKNSRPHTPSNHYFLLSKTAKEALKKYKPTEIST